MKPIILILVSSLFSILSCATLNFNTNEVSKRNADEVIFHRDSLYDYTWKVYDDTTRVKKPRIVGINGVYPLEYKLNSKELQIIKHERSFSFREPTEQGELIFQQTLNTAQRNKFERVMKQVNMEKITDASSFTPTSVAEDGFRLHIALTKDGKQEKFAWNNKYVEDLVSLLVIANNLSPEKYRFYRNEETFVQSLKKDTK
ncbi:hypothetical protein ACXYMU_16060 [Pontibacter sp. CAU 1760]